MKIYVGTYEKYNNGSICGAWLDLEDYYDIDEFYEACKELHSDEEDPELMFQDWEGIPDQYISESHLSPAVWELLEAFEKHDEEAVLAYIDWRGEWDEDDFEDSYKGQWDSWSKFVRHFVFDSDMLDCLPARLQGYFDYEAFGRDLRMGYYYDEKTKYVFRETSQNTIKNLIISPHRILGVG